jgi:RTX calcium-binding nonapeptide repeat (4 copies)
MTTASGRLLFLTTLVALASLVVPAAATTAGTIVIFGNASGTHLDLSEDRGRLVVEGHMGEQHPTGCFENADRTRAVCPLAEADAVEVEMGPGDDFVQVDTALSRSLTVYLGNGSDKFIGNAENDTCYSGGARRNRCVGGPGDDVCITGQQNSDCVGGTGDDYCHTWAGSDGCWGGPGDDVCIMGPGEDGCHGEAGNDHLYGGPGADQLYGGPGDNFCDGLPGIGRSHECHAGPLH